MNLGKVKEVSKDFIKSLIYGKSDSRTAPQCLPHGIDSKPVKGAISVYCLTENKGKAVTLGYVKNSDVTNAGETRIFATDENGNEIFSIHLKFDGTKGICEFGGNSDNFVRYSELKENYDKTKDVLDSILLALKTTVNEPGNGSPSAFQAALKLAVGTKTTGDISGCKIDNIKTN